MERWLFSKYQEPFLDINSIDVMSERVLVINSDINSFDVEVNYQNCDLSLIKTELESLMDSKHPSWLKLKKSNGDNNVLINILEKLDHNSLIMDNFSAEELLLSEINEVDTIINGAYAHIFDNVHKKHYKRLENNIKSLIDRSFVLLGDITPNTSLLSLSNKLEIIDNFFIETLLYQMSYLKKSSPITLLVWFEIFYRLCVNLNFSINDDIKIYHSQWKETALLWIGGIYSQKDITIYCSCLKNNLLNSLSGNHKRLLCQEDFIGYLSKPLSGLNFMVKIERLVEKALANLGETLILKKISDGSLENKSLVYGVFIEEFHITCRFVEMITPMLNKRLNHDIRKRMFKYYQEEFGHEKFELKTCLSLGIDKNELLNSYPLPLTQAYVDAFTHIADIDPIGFIASIMITEGMLIENSPLHDYLEKLMSDNSAYQKVSRKHEGLNIELNHSSLSRLFMQDVNVISLEAQKSAINHILYLLELNYRSLDQLTKYYSDNQCISLFNGENKGFIYDSII